jgi:hypothetical protein
MTMRQVVRLVPIVAVVLFVLGIGAPARAQPAHCFESLRDCYGSAATRQSVWDMWLAGLDCELTFTDCVRRAILGR